ncbi:hypothetical protein V8G54_037603 [Vigna mungo]|uniref:Uncharacterized protein n=1 Tax=Vigna mungo TaxID=3915 RepID=A0AAQ3MJF1_VIGMU
MPGSSSSEKNVVDSSGCADAVSVHNLKTVGSRVSNHVINPSSTSELAESIRQSFADTKCGNKGIQSGTVTSSRVVGSPKSNDKIKCMKCGGKSERQERMMDLTVEIDGEIATLEDALRQFTTAETLDGENKYNCVRLVSNIIIACCCFQYYITQLAQRICW